MIKLNRPNIHFGDHYQACVSGKREPTKSQLLSCVETLVELNSRYYGLAQNQSLYQFPIITLSQIAPAEKQDLCSLYEERMVKKKAPGRAAYDHIIKNAQGRCPLCNWGTPTTIDHYLPKEAEKYPELSIYPDNLVPVCWHCNHNKNSHSPSNAEEQYIHPYFETIDHHTWLDAKLSYSDSGAITPIYLVAELNDEILQKRINFQFNSLKLGKIYSIQASREIAEIEYGYRNLFAKNGTDEVKLRLEEEAMTRSLPYKNTWKAVLYKNLAIDNRFCKMDWIL